MRKIVLVAALGLAALGWVALRAQGQQPAAPQVPGTTAREAIDAAAAALGGAQRLQALQNITLVGYAQYAYQNGGGNISPLPGAPQKYIAANDYRRIYDVQNMRMLHQERRNDLFPFANYAGHSFALVRQGLDGGQAYNVDVKGAVQLGGDTRDRRMWFYTNPVTIVRAVLTGAATATNRRQQDDLTLVDLTLKEGDKMTLAIRPPSNLPLWVAWAAPQQNLGEYLLTTTFYGYEPFNGVQLPMGYTTQSDWRNVDQVKIYIDQYLIDSQIPSLAANATFPPAPLGGTLAGLPQVGAGTLNPAPFETLIPQVTPGQGRGGGGRGGAAGGQGQQPQPVGFINVAPGVWRFAGGTIAMEFADHIVLYELNGSNQRVHQVVQQAHQLVPGKRATQVIWSHHHFDHSSGVRQAVAEGLTIISRRDNGIIFREMTSRRAPNFPDDLERNFQPLKFIPVDDHLQLKDEKMAVDIYHVVANNHFADGVFAYIPQNKIYIEADVLTAAEELQWWGDSFLDNISYRKIEVEKILPVHMDIMTYEQGLRMLRPGIARVKEYCDEMIKKGNWFPGCPAAVR
jgi:hypothetical protein